ncbi:MAG: flagellar hook protein FlgE [Bryobacteraceae bacterium]|jgi:flagellar hook protein FlgE
MSAAFSIALSALQANSTAIDVVGNNLANLNTTGYKDTNVDFETLMAQSLGVGQNSAQVGMGVGSVGTTTDYTQGTITTTSGPMDAAIQGDGFFVVQNAAGQTLYTRDGSFQVNAAGNVETATGENVQGWPAVNGVVNANGAVGNLTVPLGTTVPAVATANMGVTVNLNAQSAVGATFSAPVQVYDSLGTAHTLSVNFTETAANAWSYTVTIPAADLATGGTPQVGSGTLAFNSSGVLTSPTTAQTVAITGLADGAAAMNINWNLNNSAGTPTITQYAEASGVGGTTQDGAAAGQITDVSLENGGLLVANYSNGQQTTVGQLALASIPNPESLTSVGDNCLQASASTGAISVGAANSAGRGQVLAGSLESSTVDMATEFTKLLTYERGYQAASRVITTSDQLLQDTMNLIHP